MRTAGRDITPQMIEAAARAICDQLVARRELRQQDDPDATVV
jgi:hypothetical protein